MAASGLVGPCVGADDLRDAHLVGGSPELRVAQRYLHGARHTVILEDDPAFQYEGRLQVRQWRSDPKYSRISIGYQLDPFKYSVVSSGETDWLWNDLFAVDVRYGRFSVAGTKYRNLINEGMKATIPTFNCTAPMTVQFGGRSYALVRGKNYNANLALKPGDNIMVFSGNGDVTVNYREVSL